MVVKDDKKAHRQVVTLGLTDGEQIEVLTGVAAGDRVIVDGLQKAKPGSPVKPVPAAEELAAGQPDGAARQADTAGEVAKR